MQHRPNPPAAAVPPVTVSLDLPCSPQAAWAAVTEADRIARWWGDYVTLDARPGGALREVWRDDTGREVVTAGTVTEFAPPALLALSWKDADWPVETRVTVRIAPNAAGARLTLTHAGWDGFPENATALRDAHEAGWRHHLGNLAALLGAGPLK